MKKLLPLLILTLFCSQAFAQNGFYVKTGVGVGSSTASYKTGAAKVMRGNKILSQNAIINIGYIIGPWQIESGMSYWQSGMLFEKDFITSRSFGPYGNQSKSYPVDYKMISAHALMPVSIGYILNKNKNVSLIPSVGIAAVYNFKKKVTTDDNIQQTITYAPNDISLMLMGSLEIQCKLSKHCDFWLRPSYQRMITPSLSSSSSNYLSDMYEYAFLFNLGVTYTVRKQHYIANTQKE